MMSASVTTNGRAPLVSMGGCGGGREHRRQVVFLYEDLATDHRVGRLRDQLLAEIDAENGTSCSHWRLGALEIPEIHATAAREAAKADLVVVVLDAPELSAPLEGEIRPWVDQIREGAVLTVIYDRSFERVGLARSVSAGLRRLRGQRRLRVRVRAVDVESPASRGSGHSQSSRGQASEKSASELPRFSPGYLRRGINE